MFGEMKREIGQYLNRAHTVWGKRDYTQRDLEIVQGCLKEAADRLDLLLDAYQTCKKVEQKRSQDSTNADAGPA